MSAEKELFILILSRLSRAVLVRVTIARTRRLSIYISTYLRIYTCLDIYTIRRETGQQERLTYWRPVSAVSLPGSVWGHKSSCALHDLANIYVSTYWHIYIYWGFCFLIANPGATLCIYINYRYLLCSVLGCYRCCWLLHPCPRESRSVKIFAYKCDLVSQHFNECQ